MAKKLGKGLDAMGIDALLSSVAIDASQTTTRLQIKQLPVTQIQPGTCQPRRHFDAEQLRALSESIQSQGIIQPVVVRSGKSGYELIAGERRWRAAKMAGLEVVPALVHECQDEEALAIALIENIQRQSLNVIEECQAIERLIDQCKLTHEEVAKRLGKSRSMVSNLLRLLSLDERVQALLAEGSLSMGHARALLSLPTRQQAMVAREAIEKQLTVRQVEALVKRLLMSAPAIKADKDANVVALERQLTDYLGAQVVIKHASKGNGTVTIRYADLEGLDGILQLMGAK